VLLTPGGPGPSIGSPDGRNCLATMEGKAYACMKGVTVTVTMDAVKAQTKMANRSILLSFFKCSPPPCLRNEEKIFYSFIINKTNFISEAESEHNWLKIRH